MDGRGPGMGRHHGRRPKGDLRLAILQMVDEQPLHGYQIMHVIEEKTGGRWIPSPGAVYPTINQLEDEGLVIVTSESGRKVVSLTDAGREQVRIDREQRPDPFGGMDGSHPGHELRHRTGEIMDAVRQIGRHGTPGQAERAAAILADARKALYLLLAEGSDAEEPAQTEPRDANATGPLADQHDQ